MLLLMLGSYSDRLDAAALKQQQTVDWYEKEIRVLSHPLGGVDEYGQLSLDNAQLVNQEGAPVQLRGVSSHGLSWYYEYLNYPAMKYFKDNGANMCRLAVYTEPTGAYLDEPERMLKTLYAAIENVVAADCYALVDWHIFNDSDPNTHADAAVEFFDRVSKQYANNPGVIYEICNEPSGATTWDDVVRYANRVIPVIRANSPNAIIVVGTPKQCTDIRSAIKAPLEFDNVMYAYHMYTKYSVGDYETELPRAKSAGLAVFVSEWGVNYDKGDEEQNYQKALDFGKFLKTNKISWAFWSLSNKDEVYSVLKPQTSKLSGWNNDDLSDMGKLALTLLRGDETSP